MITKKQLFGKRVFDVLFSLVLIPFFVVPLVILILIATIDTKEFGVFKQWRVGQQGNLFKIYKLRTLRQEQHVLGHLNKSATRLGRFFRQTKLDELPQLYNVIIGDMSFVGPRPDVQGFADELIGEDRIILKVKPGITGPATLKYKNEEDLLSKQIDPETYNRTIIWVDKIEINKKYVENYSFFLDLNFITKSILN